MADNARTAVNSQRSTVNTRNRALLVATLIAFAAASVAAQERVAANAPRAGRDSVKMPRAARVPEYQTPQTAAWTSFGAALVPTAAGMMTGDRSALLFTGLVIGPAAGYWYGHVGAKAWPGLLIRTGGFALAMAGAARCSGRSLASCSSGGSAALIGGAAVVASSAIYDIATVQGKVRAHNAAMSRAAIVPLFSPSERSVGVAVTVGF
jgi:hypothetical protein